MLTAAKSYAIAMVNSHRGIKGIDLDIKMIQEFPKLTNENIAQALSELIQDNLIIRIEYQLRDNRSQFLTFYLPEGSRLV